MHYNGPQLIRSVVLANIQRSVELDFNFEQLVIYDMKAFDQNVTGSKPEVIFEFVGTISNTTLMQQANLKFDLKKN